MERSKRKGDELGNCASKRQRLNVDSAKNKTYKTSTGTRAMPSQASAAASASTTTRSSGDNFFEGFVFFILASGIQKARLQLFRSHIQSYGGKLKDSATSDVTHIMVDDAMTAERMCRIMKIDTPSPHAQILKTAWLSACFRSKEAVDPKDYRVSMPSKISDSGNDSSTATDEKSSPDPKKKKSPASDEISRHHDPNVGIQNSDHKMGHAGEEGDYDSDYVPSEDEASDGPFSTDRPSTSSDSTPNVSPEKRVLVGKWICAQSSKAPKANLNEHITAKLEEMVKTYESTNDKWRAFGYQKAIAALRRHPKQITTWEEARSLQGVGSKLADKIWEIAESGGLRKLKELQGSEQVHVLQLFTNVWGAGPTTANAWYQQGFRTLDDLRTKASLNHQQKVGVRLYEDLLDRMPREEAAQIEAVVKGAAEAIQPGIIAQACGSYRRGKKDCGDVDILLTHPDGRSEKGLFTKLIYQLKESGFLTDDLVTVEDNGNQKKYLGVCKLPGENRKHRRLDIIVVPYEEYACALVYFTGSAHFNRSLRHLCKKMGMSLNEHALRTGVVRKGQEKVFEGTIVPTPTEESVLTALGVPYRPPEERDH